MRYIEPERREAHAERIRAEIAKLPRLPAPPSPRVSLATMLRRCWGVTR